MLKMIQDSLAEGKLSQIGESKHNYFIHGGDRSMSSNDINSSLQRESLINIKNEKKISY